MSNKTRILKLLKQEQGFTIQEILVVLLVGSILIGLSLSLFLFTNRLFSTWSGTNDLKSETNRILYSMAFDIQRAKEIVEHTDTTLTLLKGSGVPIHYRYDGKTLWRDDIDLTPKKAELLKVKVIEERMLDANTDRTPLFHITVLIQSKLLDYTTGIDAAPTRSSRLLFTRHK